MPTGIIQKVKSLSATRDSVEDVTVSSERMLVNYFTVLYEELKSLNEYNGIRLDQVKISNSAKEDRVNVLTNEKLELDQYIRDLEEAIDGQQ